MAKAKATVGMIGKIREAGAAEALAKALDTRLWTARLACEDARSKLKEHYRREVEKARRALDEADEIADALGIK
jgi:AmiR/NasT family two-component response regulator